MLKALELHGFKSFPDRTRFEFPAGITVVVGPNGSGKSNIVDAIKWVLGEQSAKNMRGKEMADVIFKGTAGTGGRKAANTAEATIVLDNTLRRLSMDVDEILISRRVYRSGEGEYLINGEPCRLKDIRNLTRGTGVGTDAYSLIEQGKVDQMLKSSPKERRLMFEEAAGISRFKAKKIEAERRLNRVEQNLVRLADIVEEVGNAYRRIKAQASKAAKYKELTDSLQNLRTHVGAKDWRDFSSHLEKTAQQKSDLSQRLESRQTELKAIEDESHQVDVQLSEGSAKVVELQADVNQRLQDVTQQQSNAVLHQSRVDDLVVQIQQQRRFIESENTRLEQMTARQDEAQNRLEIAQQACSNANNSLTQSDQSIASLQQQAEEAQRDLAGQLNEQTDIAQASNELEKQISAKRSQLEMGRQAQTKLQSTLAELASLIAEQTQSKNKYESAQKSLEDDAAEKDSALHQARTDWQEARRRREALRKEVAECRRRHSGLTQRSEVIEELEKRLEGVDTGVKELLERARVAPSPSLQTIVGMVADIIKVNVQHAELVDLALGEYAQAIVVDGDALLDEIANGQTKFAGRVRLIRLQKLPTLGANLDIDLSQQEGVMGRLDRLVQVEPAYQNFATQLLGGTWLVKNMADAMRCSSRGVRMITLQGDVLEPDGSVVAGPCTSSAGLVSRRSELRVLKREALQLEADIAENVTQLQNQDQTCQQLELQTQTLLNEHSEIASKLSDHRAKCETIGQQLDRIRQQETTGSAEQRQNQTALAELQTETNTAQSQLESRQTRAKVLKEQTQHLKEKSARLTAEITQFHRLQTSAKVELAKSEQQLDDATTNLSQLQEQAASSQNSIQATRNQLAQLLWGLRSSRREIVESMAALTQLTQGKETLDVQLQQLTDQRAEIETRRRDLAQHAHRFRDEIRQWKDQVHQIDLQQNQLSLEREQLAQRLRDDYQIDIAELDSDQEIDADRDAIDKQISDLRRSIGNIGSVNMDALNELEETQQRYESLDTQYQDLVQSKLALEKIIQKINHDSRRLFTETLEAIRQNFQKLFRQTFGGGKADLVLEEGVDVLEAGIDIMATPPGKPEFNNSLLSGGERALTAVSLLMAIFQFRPSPFCVLDEVDAPFDEANVGRFIDVLKSFLGWTKFIIVTHSKRTMTAATTLYGVTMQESGVSKRVSVRFEDVNDKGEISGAATSGIHREHESSKEDGDDQRTVA